MYSIVISFCHVSRLFSDKLMNVRDLAFVEPQDKADMNIINIFPWHFSCRLHDPIHFFLSSQFISPCYSRTRISAQLSSSMDVGCWRYQNSEFGVQFYTQNNLADLLKNDVFNVILILTDYALIDICNTICVT